MDTELAERLMELKEGMARVDERTEAILTNQEKLGKALSHHEDQDKADFKEVHTRITSVEKKQNWMLGIGGTTMFVLTLIGGFFKGIFGGG